MPEYALTMVFLDGADTKCSITVNGIKENVTIDEIKTAMSSILSTGCFKSKNGSLVSNHSAYITKKTKTLYSGVK